jgi:peptidoglycan/xylan/chitin deacetylase (PgdA/CDA1 family)
VSKVARLALKIDVDTYRGTREGVPRILELLRRRSACATFLFSLGPDHTGRAIRRVFRPGFLGKVRRTSVLAHYGLRTLLYGTLLPAPDIGRKCVAEMRAARHEGHETGIHCWDHVGWQDGIAGANAERTAREMELARGRFLEVFGDVARVHGAAGWQTNIHALRALDHLGFVYASDTRGTHPYLPELDGECFACPQLPTTLPTLDELIGTGDLNSRNVGAHILELTERPLPHVYTAHAELEGGKLIDAFDALLLGWKAQGYELVSLGAYMLGFDRGALPRHSIIAGTVPGRSGALAMQGKKVLS